MDLLRVVALMPLYQPPAMNKKAILSYFCRGGGRKNKSKVYAEVNAMNSLLELHNKNEKNLGRHASGQIPQKQGSTVSKKAV